jgi:peptidoglycan/xylan/chitin deacetylase (PgdA/CDA1 family)
MRTAILSTLSRVSWHSGLFLGLQHLAGTTQLKRRPDGTVAFPYVSKRPLPNFQILTYHRLTTDYDPFFPGLPVQVFGEQVAYLVKHYCLVNLAELIRRIKNNEPIPRNAVALTFDDGYRDNYDLAFPILLKHRVPMTLFLATGFLNRQDVLWNDKVSFAFKYTKRRQLDLDWETKRHYELETQEQRLAAVSEILWFLRHIPHSRKLYLIQELLAQLEISDFEFLWKSMLTWEQVRHMHKCGISFGAHTVTHPILSRIPLAEARHEITESKRTIEKELGSAVELFAFPAGTLADFNDDLKAILKDAGFLGAVTTVFGTNTAATDLYELRRGRTPEEADLAVFASKHCWYKFAM